MPEVHLIDAALPEFGASLEQPELPDGLHAQRLARFVDRARVSGFDTVVVYADREHAANIAYLTGFEPRFEEALLLLAAGREPVIVTGPENRGYAKVARLPLGVELYPPFGLLGQDRTRTPDLTELLRSLGVTAGAVVGLVGWKYFGHHETGAPEAWLDAPSYVVDILRRIVGDAGRVVNATGLLMDSSSGLRATNEVEQLAQFEFAACQTSEAVKRVLFGVKPGMREFEAARLLQPIGLPLSCHPMLSSGRRASLGLASPSSKVIERGEPFTVAFGVWGALNCRAGWLVEDAGELPAGIADYVERLAGPYFACVAEWYETIGIGVEGGALDAVVKRHIGDPFFGVFLNPGHLIHIDEWMNSPIYPGSTERLRSGQAIQVDIIPATGTDYFTSNIEDGIALLDEQGRAAFAERYPEAWHRIAARRAFMADVLGIRLKPEVLPLGNIPAYLPPFILAPNRVMAISR